MKVIEIKENPDGSADIEIEFDSQEENELFLRAANEMGLTLEEFLIKSIQTSAENVIKENE